MGLFTVILTSGAHIAPIVGGFIGQYLGWRWTFKFAAILDGFMFLVIVFCLPETLYVRDNSRLTRTSSERDVAFSPKTYVSQLRLYSAVPELKLRWNQFVIPALKMAQWRVIHLSSFLHCITQLSTDLRPFSQQSQLPASSLNSSVGTLWKLGWHMAVHCQSEVCPSPLSFFYLLLIFVRHSG
jgi:MFS family permease